MSFSSVTIGGKNLIEEDFSNRTLYQYLHTLNTTSLESIHLLKIFSYGNERITYYSPFGLFKNAGKIKSESLFENFKELCNLYFLIQGVWTIKKDNFFYTFEGDSYFSEGKNPLSLSSEGEHSHSKGDSLLQKEGNEKENKLKVVTHIEFLNENNKITLPEFVDTILVVFFGENYYTTMKERVSPSLYSVWIHYIEDLLFSDKIKLFFESKIRVIPKLNTVGVINLSRVVSHFRKEYFKMNSDYLFVAIDIVVRFYTFTNSQKNVNLEIICDLTNTLFDRNYSIKSPLSKIFKFLNKIGGIVNDSFVTHLSSFEEKCIYYTECIYKNLDDYYTLPKFENFTSILTKEDTIYNLFKTPVIRKSNLLSVEEENFLSLIGEEISPITRDEGVR